MNPDRSEEPNWIPPNAIEAAQAAQVREHGGQLGLRDEGLLESALARPKNRSHYEDPVKLASLAASYGYGLAKNHPFLDGDKRIALVAMNMFLILNGHEIEVEEPEVVDVMIRVADGSLDEAGLAEWITSVMVPLAP